MGSSLPPRTGGRILEEIERPAAQSFYVITSHFDLYIFKSYGVISNVKKFHVIKSVYLNDTILHCSVLEF
jgi:hypothetical protein